MHEVGRTHNNSSLVARPSLTRVDLRENDDITGNCSLANTAAFAKNMSEISATEIRHKRSVLL